MQMDPTPTPPSATFQILPLEDLNESTWNPRRSFNPAKLDELAASIREKGIIEPIVVRTINGTAANERPQFEIIAGARRFRAAALAGLTHAPAIIRDLDDIAALELAVIENGQRDDIHPLDEAEGFQALLQTAGKSAGYSVAVVAAKVGKSESYVYRRLKLLELEDDLKTALAEDRLSVAHAERLLRLPPKLRKEAAHPENGVVWRHSPLLSYAEKWIPQREDLRPLSELEHFIRQKSFFDPTSTDTRHFQPELAAQLPAEVQVDDEDVDDDNEKAVASAKAEIVLLTEDSMIRSRIGAGPKDQITLTPSQWREIKSEKQRCPHTVTGAIVHGGAPRVIDVCVTKRCQKHFPKAKKAKVTKAAKNAGPKPEADWERRQREERERRAVWEAMEPAINRAFAEHLGNLVLTPLAVVRSILSSYNLAEVKKQFGVELSEKTALQVLALTKVRGWSFEDFAASAKTWGFDAKAWRKQHEKQKAAEAKGKLDEQRKELASQKPGATKAAKKGGRK